VDRDEHPLVAGKQVAGQNNGEEKAVDHTTS
jgi:hypothetical protein